MNTAVEKLLSGIGLAVVYALTYLLLVHASITHWFLPAGLRFAALMLCPVRLWPFVILGDVGVEIYQNFDDAKTYGYPWFLAASLLKIVVVAACVYPVRRYTRVDSMRDTESMLIFLGTMIGVSLASTALNLWTRGLMHLPASVHGNPIGKLIHIYFVGDYLGILLVAPTAVALTRWRHIALGPSFRRDSLAVMLIIAGLLAVCSLSNDDEIQMLTRFLMMLPAAWTVVRHGWRGTLPASIFANVAILLTVPSTYDSHALEAQEYLGIAISVLMLFGILIEQLREHARTRNEAAVHLQRVLRTAYESSEIFLRGARDEVDHAYQTISRMSESLVGEIRTSQGPESSLLLTSGTVHPLRQRAREISDRLYPRGIEHKGLQASLLNGVLPDRLEQARVLHKLDVSARCDQLGLPLPLQLAVYRSTVDAVDLLIMDTLPRRLDLRLRCAGDRLVIRIRIDCDTLPTTWSAEGAKLFERVEHRLDAFGGSIAWIRRRRVLRLIVRSRAD